MFDYTAIGQAMKMSGRTFNQLSAEEKEEYFKTMDIMQPINANDRYSYNSFMPMPGYVPRSRVPAPENRGS